MQVQSGFLQKVYSILCCQLAMTVGTCWIVMAHPAINSMFVHSGGIMLGCALMSECMICFPQPTTYQVVFSCLLSRGGREGGREGGSDGWRKGKGRLQGDSVALMVLTFCSNQVEGGKRGGWGGE